MDKSRTNAQNCFQLLQKVLQDAFQTDTFYFTPPYKNLTQIDRGIRTLVWEHYENRDIRFWSDGQPPAHRLCIIKSNLGFYNLIAFMSSSAQPDFISIGPFRDEEISPHFFSQILKDTKLSGTTLSSMKYFYESLPLASLTAISNVTQHILTSFFPEFKNITAELLSYSEQTHKLSVNQDLLHEYTEEHSEHYKKSCFSFLNSLKKGNLNEAQENLKEFLQIANLTTVRNVLTYKKNLHMLNNYCHLALLETAIHPAHILRLAGNLDAKIDGISSQTKLAYVPYDICHKYCLLVKNYANPQYSKLTRNVTDYIQLHLEEELSLSLLAAYFQKNASALSRTFKQDTGISLTHYIHQCRIEESIRYFNTTDMSVSEVAVAVGIPDFAYFSKLFHRQIGCSPKQYRSKTKK